MPFPIVCGEVGEMLSNEIHVGDNLTFLRNRQEELAKKIDVIYIDPPYNTGNSFAYHDRNDAWVEFMRDRLSLAVNLLKDTGVMFVSIDDSSLYVLKVLCDEIFGLNNFLGTFITRQSQRSNSKHINVTHEYVVAYARNKKKCPPFVVKRINVPETANIIKELTNLVSENIADPAVAKTLLGKKIKEHSTEHSWLRNYYNIDENGHIYFAKDLSYPGEPHPLTIEELNITLPPLRTRKWASVEKITQLYESGKLVWKGGRPYEKHLLTDSEDNAPSVLSFYSRQGRHDLQKLGLDKMFDTPKPVELVKYLIRLTLQHNEAEEVRVLDFFAGSGTTAQAVYELEVETGRKMLFTLVQLDEPLQKNSDAEKWARDNNLTPTIDKLTIHRVNVFRESFPHPTRTYKLYSSE